MSRHTVPERERKDDNLKGSSPKAMRRAGKSRSNAG